MAKSSKKRHGRVLRLQEQPVEIQRKRKSHVDLIPRNIAQEFYVTDLHDVSKRIVFATGPAGTGKTYLAVQKAVQELMNQTVSKIVITRPAVTADENLGFLPGDLVRKMEPWTKPITDVIEEYYSPKDIKAMIEDGVIEVAPLGFMRGRTFKDCVIIFDEAQNATMSQMKMALTRIGDDTRMFVTGDLKQSDYRGTNGLCDFFTKLSECETDMISMTEFSQEHIERDPIVEEVLWIYGDD